MKAQTCTATPAYRPIALSSQTPSSISGDDEAFDDAAYWDAVAQGVKEEFRSPRLKALEEINEAIYSLIDEMGPGKSLNDALQMRYRLHDAKAQPHADMEALEREFTDFAFSTLKELPPRRNGDSNNRSSLAAYGGALGNTIFKTITADVMVPVLTSFLLKFSEQTAGLEYDDQLEATQAFLCSFLVLTGKERGRIAEMTATEDFEEFGRLNETAKPLVDCVTPGSAWDPWHTLVVAKIGELISPAWAEFRANNKDAPDPRKFIPLRGQLLLQKEHMSLRLWKTNGERVGRLFHNKNEFERSYFTFKWSVENDPNKATVPPIVVTDIQCVHPTRQARRAELVLAPDVLAALRWTPDVGVQQLQDKLASIFYDLSQSSTFDRGGAAAAEAKIKAHAGRHGYALAFSVDWTPPDHPQPYQVALLLDRDEFIQAARKNIILRKIEPV